MYAYSKHRHRLCLKRHLLCLLTCLMQTYREKDQWVATQLPLSNTVVDFWQLMVDNDMQVITQLEGSQVGDCS